MAQTSTKRTKSPTARIRSQPALRVAARDGERVEAEMTVSETNEPNQAATPETTDQIEVTEQIETPDQPKATEQQSEVTDDLDVSQIVVDRDALRELRLKAAESV